MEGKQISFVSEEAWVEEPRWVADVFDFADDVLERNPPASPAPVERQEALMALDGALHLQKANLFRSTYDFFLRRMRKAIEDIETRKVEKGFHLWRLYNHGFVVRSPSVTLGFDLTQGWYAEGELIWNVGLPKEWTERLAEQVDIVTISHNHADHRDHNIIAHALENGAPVWADPETHPGLPENPLCLCPTRMEPMELLHLETPLKLSPVTLRGGRKVEATIFPGHQGDTVNNVYLFRTAEGLTFMHTGDQCSDVDMAWTDRVGDQIQVDVLMVNCWAWDLPRLTDGVRPRLVFTGHETEMSHEPDHREAYWRSFQLFRDREWACCPHTLCWGEGMSFPEL